MDLRVLKEVSNLVQAGMVKEILLLSVCWFQTECLVLEQKTLLYAGAYAVGIEEVGDGREAGEKQSLGV